MMKEKQKTQKKIEAKQDPSLRVFFLDLAAPINTNNDSDQKNNIHTKASLYEKKLGKSSLFCVERSSRFP